MKTQHILVTTRLVARPGYVKTGRRFIGRYKEQVIKRDGHSTRYVDHDGFEHVWRDEKGPWYESISCACLPNGGRIHKPFEIDGKHYVAMGSGALGERKGHFLAWQVIARDQWDSRRWGKPTDYYAKIGKDTGLSARHDPRGFYHGMQARYGGKQWVLLGPPVILVADDNPRLSQLLMFNSS